jgi:anaerobic sulfite reductase subunit B
MNPYLTMPMPILSIEKETKIDWTFSFPYNKPLSYGQFFEISIPGVGEAPISVSDFNDNVLYMTIRKVGKLTDSIFNRTIGEYIHFRGPYGNGFTIDNLRYHNIIVIAGGTGLAPVRGLIRNIIINQSEYKSIHIITGFKTPDDILFKQDLSDWQETSTLTLTVDKPVDGWTGKTGLVTDFIPRIPSLKDPDTKAIVVGPPLMMKFATLALIKEGLSQENIIVSFERNMSCGLGKCGHCKIDETYVCLEGPVFPLTKAMHLID